MEKVRELWLKFKWHFISRKQMMYIPITSCIKCNELGVYRGKRKFWTIGHAIDYCVSCNSYVGVNVEWDFFDPEEDNTYSKISGTGIPDKYRI